MGGRNTPPLFLQIIPKNSYKMLIQFEQISAEDLALFLAKHSTKKSRTKSTNSPKAKTIKTRKGVMQVLDREGYKYIPVRDTDSMKIIVKTYKKPKYRKNMYARIFWEQETW